MCLSDAIIEEGSAQLLQGRWQRHRLRCSGPECGWNSRPPRFLFFFFIRILARSLFVAITLQIVHMPDVIVCLAGCNSGRGGKKKRYN